MTSGIELLADAVAELQGQMFAVHSMMESLISTHPDLDALREEWRLRSSARISSASVDAVTKGRAADRAIQHWYQWWGDYLDAEIQRRPEPPRAT